MLTKLKIPNVERRLLWLLLIADTLFIIMHIFNRLEIFSPVFSSDVFAVTYDRGLGEAFQYVKEFWIALLFASLVVFRHKIAYLGWSLLYTYFLLDDMFSFHENIGKQLATLAGYSPSTTLFNNLRAGDLGELAVSFVAALVTFSLIAVSYKLGDEETKKVFNDLFILLAILIFFGVALDIVDRLFNSRMLKGALGLAEDGGEMLIMSVIFWYTYILTRAKGTLWPIQNKKSPDNLRLTEQKAHL
jgi:hypothetical protein